MPYSRGKTQQRLQTAIIVFLMLYIGAHFTLSRLSLSILRRECQDPLTNGFYYLPCGSLTIGKSDTLQIVNLVLVYFFYPIWAVDFYLLGGPDHMGYPMVEFSS